MVVCGMLVEKSRLSAYVASNPTDKHETRLCLSTQVSDIPV
jgi:hypothetical protein